MNDPCVKCMERDRCNKAGLDLCKKKEAFIKYKAKCKEIAENTVNIMAAAREKILEQGVSE
ncbi:MAG: hypothetical protein KBT03_12065 [Bacteroidales bacterium]|nr:hypothetical protein [Candidatus Scybalousia scybalohippi]